MSRECILSDEVDVIVDVVDASCLERNLYLTLQLIELGKPVVLALNMMDIVEERGMEIDLHRLPRCHFINRSRNSKLIIFVVNLSVIRIVHHPRRRYYSDPVEDGVLMSRDLGK